MHAQPQQMFKTHTVKVNMPFSDTLQVNTKIFLFNKKPKCKLELIAFTFYYSKKIFSSPAFRAADMASLSAQVNNLLNYTN